MKTVKKNKTMNEEKEELLNAQAFFEKMLNDATTPKEDIEDYRNSLDNVRESLRAFAQTDSSVATPSVSKAEKVVLPKKPTVAEKTDKKPKAKKTKAAAKRQVATKLNKGGKLDGKNVVFDPNLFGKYTEEIQKLLDDDAYVYPLGKNIVYIKTSSQDCYVVPHKLNIKIPKEYRLDNGIYEGDREWAKPCYFLRKEMTLEKDTWQSAKEYMIAYFDMPRPLLSFSKAAKKEATTEVEPMPNPSVPKPKTAVPSKTKLEAAAKVVPVAKLAQMTRLHIKCELFGEQITGNDAQIIPFVGGEMVAYPGDYVLYLGDGHPFTVIQKDNFKKRCVEIEAGEKAKVRTTKADGTKTKVKTSKETGELTKKVSVKKAKRRVRTTEKTDAEITKLATKMVAEKCDVAKFTKETAGTPIDAALWGRIAEWNAKKTLEKVTRIGISAEGDFVAEMVDWEGIIVKNVIYYSVCPDRGIWTLLTDAEKAKAIKNFDEKKFAIQYSKAEIGRMYNYGDPSVKKFEENKMSCKTLAQDAYNTRKEKGRAEARPKYLTHYNTCRNNVLNEYNRAYLIKFNDLVREHRNDNKALTWSEARKEVKIELLNKAAKMAA